MCIQNPNIAFESVSNSSRTSGEIKYRIKRFIFNVENQNHRNLSYIYHFSSHWLYNMTQKILSPVGITKSGYLEHKYSLLFPYCEF